MTLKELRGKMARIAANARAKFDEITPDTPEERAAEIEREFDAMMAEHDQLAQTVERQERLEAAEARSNGADPRRPGAEGEARGGAPEGDGPTYRDAFHAMLRAGGVAADLDADMRSALLQGEAGQEVRQQLTTTGASGGFLVPTELSDQIIVAMEATGPMYDPDFIFEITTGSGAEMDVPALDDTGDTSTSQKAEADDVADDGSGDIELAQRVLNAYMFDTPFVKWSMEMGTDSIVNVEKLLARVLGMRLGKIANQQLTVGTGTNAPNGVVNASGLGITAAAAAAITSDELLDLVHSVNSIYRPGASFMMNDLTVKAVRKLKDGDGNYLWSDGDFQKSIPSSLLGHRVAINDAMAGMATGEKPITFGDMKQYYVRKVGSPIMGVMRERFWPKLGIAGLIRFDGELGDVRAVKHLQMG